MNINEPKLETESVSINQYYAKNLRCIFKSLPKFAKVFTNTFYGDVYDLKC